MLRFEIVSEDSIPIIQALAEDIWWKHFPDFLSNEQIEYMLDWMYSESKIKQEIEIGFQWTICFLEDEPVGYLSYKKESLDTIFLSKFYLKQEFHGKGFAKEMLNHLIEKTQLLNANSIRLTVNIHNQKAIRFYEKHGFQKTNSVKMDIGNGFFMDDFIYKLDL